MLFETVKKPKTQVLYLCIGIVLLLYSVNIINLLNIKLPMYFSLVIIMMLVLNSLYDFMYIPNINKNWYMHKLRILSFNFLVAIAFEFYVYLVIILFMNMDVINTYEFIYLQVYPGIFLLLCLYTFFDNEYFIFYKVFKKYNYKIYDRIEQMYKSQEIIDKKSEKLGIIPQKFRFEFNKNSELIKKLRKPGYYTIYNKDNTMNILAKFSIIKINTKDKIYIDICMICKDDIDICDVDKLVYRQSDYMYLENYFILNDRMCGG